jgi:drug/metabolite transporter (DMT)-like permease
MIDRRPEQQETPAAMNARSTEEAAAAPGAAIHHTMTAGEWGLLVALAVLWAGSYLYVGIAVKAVPPFSLVAFRVGLGAVLLYLCVKASGGKMPRDWAAWRVFFVMGVTNNVIPFSLIAFGQERIPAGLAAIINATTPLFTVVFAHFMTRDEKLSPLKLAGVVVGFGGVVILIGPDALKDAGAYLIYELTPLLAAVFYALSAIYGRRASKLGVAPLTAATGQIVAAAAIMVPVALVTEQPWTLPMPGWEVWASLIALAALSTTVAYIIFYRVLATAGSVNLMLVTFMVPVGAVILGAIVLGERLAPNHFLGMLAIGIGLAAIDGRLFRMMRRQPA